EAATFENTFVALERSGKPLDRVTTMFFTLASSRNTPAVQELAGVVRPKLSKAEDRLYFNEKLFKRIAAVYEGRAELSAQQKRLVEKTYDAFIRRGAQL